MATDVIRVAHAGDVGVARQAAQDLARSVGFDDTACAEIGIAASELAVNLVKHAHGGQLRLSTLESDEERGGVQIVSDDDGPGIADVERALTDGFTTGRSWGYGLGTVHRLMDTCEITSQPGHGTHIVATRWLRPVARRLTPFPLDAGVATRPYHGMEVNGDAFIVTNWGASLLVGIIDGLGHGPFAHRAAETARQFVESHEDRPLEEIFRGVARVCRPTRGVVMALARFDVTGLPLAGGTVMPISTHAVPPLAIRLSFASIGNVEARVLNSPEPISFMIRRGVLGATAPTARQTDHAWDLRSVLVLHSDGVAARWRWDDFPDLAMQPAGVAAQQMLRALAKDEDDATVVVVKATT